MASTESSIRRIGGAVTTTALIFYLYPEISRADESGISFWIPGNYASLAAGKNAEEGGQAGKRRRAVGRQREQHYRDAYHRLPDAGNLHTEKERDDGRDFQQRTIGTIERSRALD